MPRATGTPRHQTTDTRQPQRRSIAVALSSPDAFKRGGGGDGDGDGDEHGGDEGWEERWLWRAVEVARDVRGWAAASASAEADEVVREVEEGVVGRVVGVVRDASASDTSVEMVARLRASVREMESVWRAVRGSPPSDVFWQAACLVEAWKRTREDAAVRRVLGVALRSVARVVDRSVDGGGQVEPVLASRVRVVDDETTAAWVRAGTLMRVLNDAERRCARIPDDARVEEAVENWQRLRRGDVGWSVEELFVALAHRAANALAWAELRAVRFLREEVGFERVVVECGGEFRDPFLGVVKALGASRESEVRRLREARAMAERVDDVHAKAVAARMSELARARERGESVDTVLWEVVSITARLRSVREVTMMRARMEFAREVARATTVAGLTKAARRFVDDVEEATLMDVRAVALMLDAADSVVRHGFVGQEEAIRAATAFRDGARFVATFLTRAGFA